MPNPVLKNSSDGIKVVSWSPLTIAHQVHSIISLQVIKKESTRRSSNKWWKKTLYRDYSHRIANFCATVSNIFSKEIIFNNTKCLKQILKFIWNTGNYWWNETDDDMLPLFAQLLWTLKFIFSRFHGKLFSVLFQATIYISSF